MKTAMTLRVYEMGLNVITPEDVIRSHDHVAAMVETTGNQALWNTLQEGIDDSTKPRATRAVG